MKNTTIYFLAVLLILGSTYQACCEACVSKLTVDSNMHGTDSTPLPVVRTYTVPSKEAEDVDPEGFCGEVFEEHGTCCNQEDLKKRADAWSDRLKNRSEKIMKGFDKMDKLVDSIGKVKEWANKHKVDLTVPENRILKGDQPGSDHKGAKKQRQHKNQHKKQNSEEQQEHENSKNVERGDQKRQRKREHKNENESSDSTNRILKGPHNSSNQGGKGKGKGKNNLEKPKFADLDKLENELDKVGKGNQKQRRKREHNAKKENKECHKELMKMRKAALCLRCSGVATDYFEEETGSYKVDEKICSVLIEKCATVFAAVAEANSLYTNLATLKKVKGGAVSDDAESDVLDEDKLGKWQHCGDDKDACLGDMARVKELCAQISLSSDNQALEGNLATTSEGIETGEAIENGNEPTTSAATDFFSGTRLLNSKAQSNIQRTLETADDGYGYAIPSTTGANLITDFSSGLKINKVLLSLGFLFAGLFLG